jgi:hypothetical protein
LGNRRVHCGPWKRTAVDRMATRTTAERSAAYRRRVGGVPFRAWQDPFGECTLPAAFATGFYRGPHTERRRDRIQKNPAEVRKTLMSRPSERTQRAAGAALRDHGLEAGEAYAVTCGPFNTETTHLVFERI